MIRVIIQMKKGYVAYVWNSPPVVRNNFINVPMLVYIIYVIIVIMNGNGNV